jgi:hypothetical protein
VIDSRQVHPATNQSGGVVAAYGTSMANFAVELAGMKDEWIQRSSRTA